ncbi:UNKNOWN [Stylonychia lemnae]|uniref:J domain-containing protein n=1 Tax=Stylonychia lemnae TaxID=5949 RepID=A0A078A8G4_STYLE|nr:UNKNOWN [Stylonychia lemnae]|eukprot:CDW77071.1 UNKNOWN [Stylonychia lemnae]
MNQDESTKCIQIAKSAISQKDFDKVKISSFIIHQLKAKRFLEKSMRLHETGEAKKLLEMVIKRLNGDSKVFDDSQSTTSQSTHASTSQKKHATQHQQPQEPPNYSKEDVERCKAIINKKDYYDILGVTKTATEDEVKKAYKKLALKFHPDKNRAPNATDAFKKVSQAFACLSNAEKKRIYDQHGSEENFQQRYQQSYYQEDFNPHDIFSAFFGFDSGMARRHHQNQRPYQQQQRQHQQQNREQHNNPMALLQMGPLLLILLVSILSSFGSIGTGYTEKSYAFSYSQTYQYPVQVVSYRLSKAYFVSQWTANDLRADLNKKYKLDEKVEDDIIKRYEGKCEEAKKQRQMYINLSKKYSEDLKNYDYYLDKILKNYQ